MKNRLYALVMATMMLFVPLVAFGIDLSSNISPLSDKDGEGNLPSKFPGDTVIQFPDSAFEAAVREFIAKPKGNILASDVAEITELDVSDLLIADLTGIEYFTALEVLNCGENQLTALDASQNNVLKELYCWDNQLMMLDVSQNIAMNKLYCGVNQLTLLDISHNTALEELNCDDNQLITLNVSQNLALKYLSCDYNQLTTLDVSHNTVLEILLCEENPLTELVIN